MGAKRVIIDVDVGTDDYMAILLLLYAEKRDLLHVDAITCTFGNTSLNNVCKNTVRLLEILGRTDIPVFKGAHQPLILHKDPQNVFHGADGFGDLNYDAEPALSMIQNDPASKGIRDLIVENPNEITLMCLGPLTNVALTLKLYDDFAPNLKDLWLMGGNYSGVENSSSESSAEFNFFCDPEAAFIAFECLSCPMYVLPWETCLKPSITFDWRYKVLDCKSPAMELLTKAEKAVYPQDDEHWMPCDAFLAFAYVNPEKYITKCSRHSAQIELHNPESRGQFLINESDFKVKNITVIEEFNEEHFKDLVLAVASSLCECL